LLLLILARAISFIFKEFASIVGMCFESR